MTRATLVKAGLFAAAVALATAAAAWRWPDSAHAIAVIKRGGGQARHGVTLQPGPDRWELIVTAPVLPPWRGDARVDIEGTPPMPFEVELSRPIVDLGLHHWPRLEGTVIRDLVPGDRIALWVQAAPPAICPVCGMACTSGAVRDGERCFCSEGCRDQFRDDPGQFRDRGFRGQPYRLVLRDAADGALLTTVPLALGGGKGGKEGGHEHH